MVNLEQQESNRGTQFLSEYFLGLSDNEIRIHNIDAYLKGVRFGFDPTTNALGAINYTRAPTYAVTSKGRKIGLPPRKDGYAYPRYISSYGQEVLEKAISYVEQGIETGLAQSKIEGTYERPLAIVLPSGMAALTYVLNLIQNMQKKQDISIIVAPNDCYGGTRSLIATSNINVIYAKDCTEAALQVAFDQQNRKTHAILFETLTNPFVRIADTETIVRFAKDHNIITIADSTLAPFSRPLEYGADFNAISLTKYATENNVMLGAVVVNRERTDLFHKLIAYHDLHGSLPGEHEIRLAISTITTMVDSFRIHSKNGLIIANWLMQQPQISKVFYPGLGVNPQEELAQKYLGDLRGSLITFEFKRGRIAAQKFLEATNQPLRGNGSGLPGMHEQFLLAADSLGAPVTLLNYMCQQNGAYRNMTPEQRAEVGITNGTFRLAGGTQPVEFTLAALSKAFEAIPQLSHRPSHKPFRNLKPMFQT